MFEKLVRQLLWRLSPETAHQVARWLIRLRYPSFATPCRVDKPARVFGLTFPNPIGLAAGWDKNAECFDALFRMGFGFVEVGGVTPKPQVGNPRPRLFRLPQKQALINRMGFDNAGIDALVEKLKTRNAAGILGVNIAKNKETPLANAADDYQICLKAIYPYADYAVINISSPNTPGLRELQSERFLNDLLSDVQKTRKNAAATFQKELPILVKTTIDLPVETYPRFVRTLLDNQIDGMVISNTTVQHQEKEQGGLSGAPLRERVTKMIRTMTQLSENQLPVIGCGGVMSGKDAVAHIEAGATLVEIFTGFIYRGTALINEIANALNVDHAGSMQTRSEI